MDTNTNKMEENAKEMREEMKGMRGEMQQMGRGLQAGIMAMARDETRTAGEKMATPRAETNELGGSATAVGPVVEAGEDRVIQETCLARVVTKKVTETVTERGKLIGVTETCTREIRHEVKGIGRERKDEVRGDRERARSETKGRTGAT